MFADAAIVGKALDPAGAGIVKAGTYGVNKARGFSEAEAQERAISSEAAAGAGAILAGTRGPRGGGRGGAAPAGGRTGDGGAAPGAGAGGTAEAASAEAGAARGGGGSPTSLFRIITEPTPEANLLSNADKGLAPRGPELANPAIHGGLSMFGSLEGAAAKVPILQRGGKTVLGIGEFTPGPGVTVQKTLGPGHYTVSGTTPDLMQSWVQSVIRW